MPSNRYKYVESCTKVHTMQDGIKKIPSPDRFSKSKTETKFFEIPKISEKHLCRT